MNSPAAEKVSTTRLAKLAGLDSRQLFERLLERKWLVRAPSSESGNKSRYRLTAKGKFEGGEYHQSDKFGEYIVWPSELLSHNLLQSFEEKKLTATAIGRVYGVPARLVNLVLAELGWIENSVAGWQATAQGLHLGAEVKESDQGVSYVLWPRELQEQKALCRVMQQLTLTTATTQQEWHSLDGRTFSSEGERLIANWLYLHRLSYACQRHVILKDTELPVGFYLPQMSLVIEYCGYHSGDTSPAAIQNQLTRLDALRASSLQLIEIDQSDLANLDAVLSKQLLKSGLKVY